MRIDVPPPTIVGPRPEAGRQGTIAVPRGMEKLLTLAGLNEAWKEKTLVDPLKAAAEAEIPLSPSESASLKSIPRQTLSQMILSFARAHLAPIRDTAFAAGTAAAALLATATPSQGQGARYRGEFISLGITPDEPAALSRPPAPVGPHWEETVVIALTNAAASNQAVMVVFPYGEKITASTGDPSAPMAKVSAEPTSPYLKSLCDGNDKTVLKAAFDGRILAVKPYPGMVPLGERWKVYLARLEFCHVAGESPLVVFLAPDGSVLSKVTEPVDEKKLVEAMKAVPPLLAEWITKQRKPVAPAPPATKGMTLKP